MTVGAGFEDDPAHVPGLDREAGADVVPVLVERPGRRHVEAQGAGLEARVGPVHLGAMRLTAVVEARFDAHLEVDRAAHAADAAHQPVPVGRHARVLDGHEVDQLRHTCIGEEPSDEDRGVGQVHLLRDDVVADGRDRESSALVVIE